jgi:hypothetical protein
MTPGFFPQAKTSSLSLGAPAPGSFPFTRQFFDQLRHQTALFGRKPVQIDNHLAAYEFAWVNFFDQGRTG